MVLTCLSWCDWIQQYPDITPYMYADNWELVTDDLAN